LISLRKSRGFGSLNIKNPETHKLAGRLAELTGESLAPAVTQSLRERLSRFQAPGSIVAKFSVMIAGYPNDRRSSGDIAILRDEPEAERFGRRLLADGRRSSNVTGHRRTRGYEVSAAS
jgi:Rv0623-like transcription factor